MPKKKPISMTVEWAEQNIVNKIWDCFILIFTGYADWNYVNGDDNHNDFKNKIRYGAVE